MWNISQLGLRGCLSWKVPSSSSSVVLQIRKLTSTEAQWPVREHSLSETARFNMQGGEQDFPKFLSLLTYASYLILLQFPGHFPGGVPLPAYTGNSTSRKTGHLGQREHEWVPPAGSECLSSTGTCDTAQDCWALGKSPRSSERQVDNLILRVPFTNSLMDPYSLWEIEARCFMRKGSDSLSVQGRVMKWESMRWFTHVCVQMNEFHILTERQEHVHRVSVYGGVNNITHVTCHLRLPMELSVSSTSDNISRVMCARVCASPSAWCLMASLVSFHLLWPGASCVCSFHSAHMVLDSDTI